MPCGKKRKRHKIATHKRKKRLRKNRHKKKTRQVIILALDIGVYFNTAPKRRSLDLDGFQNKTRLSNCKKVVF